MEDFAGGPMLRPPGIAPEGTAGDKARSEQGSPCALPSKHQALPLPDVHKLSHLVCPALAKNK